MDIYLAAERAFTLTPLVSLEIARDRLEQKKVNLIAGSVGALLTRPKPEEIRAVSVENRLEPFWLINVSVHTTYDRSSTYTVPVSGPEIRQVVVFGQERAVSVNPKGAASFTLDGLEKCVEERRASYTFDGATGEKADFSKYLACAKSEISDLEHFAPEGVLVVPPQAHATAILRPVLAEMIQPARRCKLSCVAHRDSEDGAAGDKR